MPDMDGFGLAERISRDGRCAGTKLVMLTSAGEPEDVVRCRKLGISAHLTKPIKQSELFDVIVSVISEPIPKKTKPRKKSRIRKSGRRVLLAEDNQVNQLVATRILEKLGHQVTVVSSGREALLAVQSGKFDLVAMDVQMPEMDGLEATAAIRRWERDAGTHIPIIAMTAHAIKGDRERCLEAGMDGYTSKPIRIKDLEQVISELAPSASTKRHAAKGDARHPVIDHHALLEGFDGSRALLKEMARLFLADYPQRVEEIKESIRRRDATALARAAHALKGSVGNFAAKEASAIAQRLENIGRNGQLDAAGEGCIELESELALVAKELRRLIANPSQTRTRPARRARGQARKPT